MNFVDEVTSLIQEFSSNSLQLNRQYEILGRTKSAEELLKDFEMKAAIRVAEANIQEIENANRNIIRNLNINLQKVIDEVNAKNALQREIHKMKEEHDKQLRSTDGSVDALQRELERAKQWIGVINSKIKTMEQLVLEWKWPDSDRLRLVLDQYKTELGKREFELIQLKKLQQPQQEYRPDADPFLREVLESALDMEQERVASRIYLERKVVSLEKGLRDATEQNRRLRQYILTRMNNDTSEASPYNLRNKPKRSKHYDPASYETDLFM